MDKLAYNIDDFLTTLYSQISGSLLSLMEKLNIDSVTTYILCNEADPSVIHSCRKIKMTPKGLSVDLFDPPMMLSPKYSKLTSPHSITLPVMGISAENKSYVAAPVRTFKGFIGVIVCEKNDPAHVWVFSDISSLIDCTHEIQDPVEKLVALLSLKSKTNRLQFILNNIRDVILVYDKNGFATYISENLSQNSDYTSEDIIGKNCLDLIHPDQHHEVFENFEILNGGYTKPYDDFLMKHKDGKYYWWRFRCQPIMKDGELDEVISVISNVDEEKKMLDRLAESEEKYRLLAENASDIIFTLNTQLKFTYISPSVTRMRGWTVEEAMSQSIAEALTPESLDLATGRFNEAMCMDSSGQIGMDTIITLELEETCKDKSTIWTETSFSPIMNPEGKMTGILGITRDITARKLAEKRDAQNTLQQNFILNNIKDIIMVTDTNGVISYITPNVASHTDYTHEELIGQSAIDFVHPDHHEDLKKARNGYSKGIPARTQEYKIRVKNGFYSWYRLNSQPILVDGMFQRVVSLVYNIDEEMKERERAKASQENYRLLAENIADMVITYDLKARKPFYISPSCEKFFGIRRDELESILSTTTPESYSRIMTPDSQRVVLQFINDKIEEINTGTIDYDAQTLLDIQLINAEGSPERFETSVSFIDTKDGSSILSVSRNLSARNIILVQDNKKVSIKREKNERKVKRSLKAG